MSAKDFDITVRDDNAIAIRGEKRVRREDTRGDFHVIECAYGRFELVIPLPEAVSIDKANAEYEHGVLRVRLPKLNASRRVPVRVH